MNSVSQEARKVKIDVDALMRAACPNCKVKGYVSVGGLGNEITVRCGLCEFSWSPMPPRACCVCGDPFAPGDETQVLCPGCEALGTRCGCVMPWQSCEICEAVARVTNDGDELPF
jgi:hypothetical protein